MKRIFAISSFLLLFIGVGTAQALTTYEYTVTGVHDYGGILLEDDLEEAWYIIPVYECSVEEQDVVYIDQVVQNPREGEDITTPSNEICEINFVHKVEDMAYLAEDLGDDKVVITNSDGDQLVVEYYECDTIGNYVGDLIMLSTSDDDEGLLVLPNGAVCTVYETWTKEDYDRSGTEPEPDFSSVTDATLYFIDETKAALVDAQAEIGEAHPEICKLIKETYIPTTTELKRDLRDLDQTSEVVWATRMLDEYVTELRRLERECKSASGITGTVFSDISDRHPARVQIMYLRDNGVLKGYDDGTFRPDNPVNRAELLKIIVEGIFPEELKGEKNCFPDVKDEWYSQYICAAKRLGWVGGYPDGTFKPGNTVNRAEAIKMIVASYTEDRLSLETLPTDVNSSDWFAPFVRKALEHGFETYRGPFRPGANLTRTEAAVWIYNGLQLEN